MKVLIGIVTKNRKKILRKAIESAIFQDYPYKEIAVFDDASIDGTWELEKEYSKVTWFLSPESVGYLYARNKLMQETNADYYCSLDDDSWFLERDCLSKAVAYMTKYPSTGAIAFGILSPDKPDCKLVSTRNITNTFVGCGHLLRLYIVKQIDFYTHNPGFYGGEEKDMAIRLQDNGYNVVYMPELNVWHDKTLVARDLVKQHRSGVCNDLVFATRRIPFPLVLAIVPGKIFNHIRFSVKNQVLKHCLLGIIDYLKFLPKTLLTRKPVKKKTYLNFRRLSKNIV